MRDALLRMVLYFDIFKHPLTDIGLEKFLADHAKAAGK